MMLMRTVLIFAMVAVVASGGGVPDMLQARDKEDRAALERVVGEFRGGADKQANDAEAQYRYALAQSYAAEVGVELRDKVQGKSHAEAGITAAEKAVRLKPSTAEYHRILGTLCGQIISSSGLAAITYGKCALAEVNKAIELDPKSSVNYLSHGVGNYYLPPAFGSSSIALFTSASAHLPYVIAASPLLEM